MAVLLLIAVAGGLLAFGWSADEPTLVWIALGASVMAILAILIGRFGPLRARRFLRGPVAVPRTARHDEPVGPDQTTDGDSQVVFVAGRMAFHSPDCHLVRERSTGTGPRDELEAGGMYACGRCLKS